MISCKHCETLKPTAEYSARGAQRRQCRVCAAAYMKAYRGGGGEAGDEAARVLAAFKEWCRRHAKPERKAWTKAHVAALLEQTDRSRWPALAKPTIAHINVKKPLTPGNAKIVFTLRR